MPLLPYYLAVPLFWFALSGLLAFPTYSVRGHVLGGGPLREWIHNHLLLPLLPLPWAQSEAAFFNSASFLQEWLIASVVVLPYLVAIIPILLLVAPPIGRLRKEYRQSLHN